MISQSGRMKSYMHIFVMIIRFLINTSLIKLLDRLMETHPVMTMADLLCYLREQVIKAREQDNTETFTELYYALSLIQDAIENGPDKTYWWIVDDFINA